MPNKQPSTEYTGVYTAIFPNKTPREIELEARVKELEEKLNAQFAEMEEKLTAEEMKNFKLREKLSIAKEELWKISDAFYRGTTLSELCYIAKQALQKIKEVKTNRCETCKHHYTDYDCLHDYCNVNDKEISINDSCEKWEK